MAAFGRMGCEAEANIIQDHYLAGGDSQHLDRIVDPIRA
jgi:hypothetical protein